MSDLFTWSMLVTVAGASAATAMITHLIKEKFDAQTQIVSYVVAVVVLVVATLFTTGPNPSALILCLFNGLVVASGASNSVAFVNRQTKDSGSD